MTKRRGFTLIELMISMAITAILVGTLSVLASGVRQTSEFSSGQTDALQHGQVTLDRIQTLVTGAYATETYPGAIVVDQTVGSYRYPDTLVVWSPSSGTPVNTNGPPLVKELVIICPHPTSAGQLCQIVAANDTRTVQLNDASLNTTTGRALISGLKTATTSTVTVLTPLLRTASAATSQTRGAVRFECELHPTAAEISAFRAGTATWSSLSWCQSLVSNTYGLRQVWVRSEVQLWSDAPSSDGTVSATTTPIPFFGSATLYYALQQ
jgi:prepilin-type N-terminal cleavage/methylation domain-containing protein